MVRNFRSEDEGKSVVTADGDIVGHVEQTSGSMAHVKTEGGLSQSIRRRLGWTEEGEETYELRKSRVEEITDDEIRLKKNL
jgi:hypothetical protein